MGLSASQARFLQLTARRSNIEYQAQQINFQRLQLANQMDEASMQYQETVTNRKMVFTFNNGTGPTEVDVTYNNYKNYMNQQQAGSSVAQKQLYLLTTSGKIVVGNEEERAEMIKKHTSETISSDEYNKRAQEGINVNDFIPITTIAEDGSSIVHYEKRQFSEDDFYIAEDLEDVDSFQDCIKDGIYYFGYLSEETDPKTGITSQMFKTESWDTIGGGVISEEYDKTDDAEAEARFEAINSKLERLDKYLELELDKLESERSAIQTEMDSVEKVIGDSIEKSFNTFS